VTYLSNIIEKESHYIIQILHRLLSIIQNWFLEYPAGKNDPYKFSVQSPETRGQIGVPAIVDDILGQKRDGFFIECGAFDGESIRYLSMDRKYFISCILLTVLIC